MKKPISATIDEELIVWLDEYIKNGSPYRNKSHLIETALEMFKQQLKKRK